MKYFRLLNDKSMNTASFFFPVMPGALSDKYIWLDIECTKVLAPDSWPYLNRTKTIMVGLAYFSPSAKGTVISVITGNEYMMMNRVRNICTGKTIVYSASPDYDRLVLEGRWTYRRRSPMETPGDWPNVGEGLRWFNMRKDKSFAKPSPFVRSLDVESKRVPELWRTDIDIVLLHNVRDVLELLLTDTRAPNFKLNPLVMEGLPDEALAALAEYAF